MKTVRIRVLSEGIPGYAVGQEVRVEVDHEGTPLDAFWRRRLRDARVDECCEVVRKAAAKKASRRRSSAEPSEKGDE